MESMRAKTARKANKATYWIIGRIVLFVLILILGIFARLWEFGSLPRGLNQDEASIGVEAYDLYKFGVDRNGVSFPVNFISWGNGMDALDGYILIPFVAVFGLTPVTVRLPSLLSGIFTIPLIYIVSKRIFGDETMALLSMFLLAISPWHILMSRWGINENVLPFVFMLGFLFMLQANKTNVYYLISCVFLSLSLYAYGGAYVAALIFLACATAILLISKRITVKTILPGIILFALLITPIVLFVLINQFKWGTIHLGSITIPRLPERPRYEAVSAPFSTQALHSIFDNILQLFKLLIQQTDRQIFNVVEPFGYLYTVTFPLIVFGIFLLFPSRGSKHAPERWLLLAWLAAASVIGIFQPATINRMCLMFIPLIICMALFLGWIGKRSNIVFVSFILALLVGFILFNQAYHGKAYREESAIRFFPGFLSAVDYARQAGDISDPVCLTDKVNMPYIFVQFSEKADPIQYVSTINYLNTRYGFRFVRNMGRYTFGLKNCSNRSGTIYITKYDEPLPASLNTKLLAHFDDFLVYRTNP